jgi:nucleoid-associated protein YgaU
MNAAADLAGKLLAAGGADPFKEYAEAKAVLAAGGRDLLRRELAERLRGRGTLDPGRTLLVAGVYRLAGAGDKAIFNFIARNCPARISLPQFNFVETALFPEGAPVPSDVKFELTGYSYFDNALIFRKVFKLVEQLKGAAGYRLLTYLLLLFVRNDLSNENRMLVGLILNNLDPAIMTKVIPKELLREYKDFVEGTLRSKRVKNEVRLALRDNDSGNMGAFLESNFSFTRGDSESDVFTACGGVGNGDTAAKTRTGETVSNPGEAAPAVKKRTAGARGKRPAGKGGVAKGAHAAPRAAKKPSRRRSVAPVRPPHLSSRETAPGEPVFEASPKGHERAEHLSPEFRGYRRLVLTFVLLLAIGSALGAGGHFARRTLARRSGGTRQQVPAPTDGSPVTEPEGSGGIVYYTVRRGDTLSRISKKYFDDSSVYPLLAERNGIRNPHLIFPDQLLEIPR